MKTNVSIASCSFLIAFAYVMAQAQDAYRHDAALDVSVRAGVEEQEQKPPQGNAKQPAATLSDWSFQHARAAPAADKRLSSFSNSQPSKQAPTSTGLPKRAMTATLPNPAEEEELVKPITTGTLPSPYGYGKAKRPPAFTPPVLPISSLPGSQGFSKPFDRDLFGLTNYYPFSTTGSPASRGVARTWQHKPRAKKSSGVVTTAAPLGPPADKIR